ncbi:MAG: hypothetical protein QNJ72_24375 [Pleurocapsa sp. MO_226.B13]|nr:hypothetical protein [Pleurocapsa sp. MO_226.B13]
MSIYTSKVLPGDKLMRLGKLRWVSRCQKFLKTWWWWWGVQKIPEMLAEA